MNERRRFARHPIQVPVNVSTRVRRNRAGVIRDVSASGVLFHSESKFEVGERLILQFRLADAKGTTAGHVVRVVAVDEPVTFPYLTAVQFEAPLLDLPL